MKNTKKIGYVKAQKRGFSIDFSYKGERFYGSGFKTEVAARKWAKGLIKDIG